MLTYSLDVWSTASFPNYNNFIVPALGFPRPERAIAGAPGLIAFSASGDSATIYATVQQGSLDNGVQVQNGVYQIGTAQTFDQHWTMAVAGVMGQSSAIVLFYCASTGVADLYSSTGNGAPLSSSDATLG